MGAWRSKLIFTLVVFFAGFASAIYCLAPAPDAKARKAKKGFAYSVLESDNFAKSFNVEMRRCLHHSKDAAKRFSVYLKRKTSKRGD